MVYFLLVVCLSFRKLYLGREYPVVFRNLIKVSYLDPTYSLTNVLLPNLR
jgi:hypothetical protein